MVLAPDDPRHGTRNAYANLGCRCPACRQARNVYDAKRISHRRAEEVAKRQKPPHCPHCPHCNGEAQDHSLPPGIGKVNIDAPFFPLVKMVLEASS